MSDDAILTSIMAGRLRTIGQRMGVVVERSARSPLLVEGRDFSLGIYDARGILLEQTEYIPVLGYATAPGMRAIAEAFRGNVAEGDVVLHNDPFTGGNQLSDWKVAKPVFHEGEQFGWVVIAAHQADVGGAVPGSYNPNATDLWQEGLRITPLKLFEGGKRRDDVWNFVFGNVRLDVVADDVSAMIGSCTVGERELKALLARYGIDTVRAAASGLLDAAERAARSVIERVPDGEYAAEWYVHDDGIDHDLEATIRVVVVIDGDHARFDFTGTDPQVRGYVNAPLAVTISSVMIAFFMIADEELPHNDGIMRCVEVVAPEGCLVNPRFPAPTGFGNHLSDQIAAVIMLALAPAVPRQVTACWNHLLATIIAGALGVLAASITQLNTSSLPLQVVPALAAVLFAQFTSFWIAAVAGLAIGMAENILYYMQTQSWFPTDGGVVLPGIQPLLVFIVIVIAMFWRGTTLPSRGALIEQRLPIVPRAHRLLRSALIATMVCVVALILFPYDLRQALINTLIGAMICLSLVVITGFVGQISLVQLALAGVAGFTLSHLASDHGVAFPIAPLVGALGATLLGLLVAISAVRVRGVSLAIVTLGAAVAIEQFVFLNRTWGGGSSSSPVPPPTLWGLDLGPNASFRGLDGDIPSPVFGFVVVGLMLLMGLAVASLRRASLGQQMLAVRSNERAAAAAGINVRNVKLTAFGCSSFIAGIAGAMYGYNFGSVTVGRFSALTALGLIAFAYVGGITMVSGAIIAGLISTGALFPYALEKWLNISGNWALLFGGVALIVTLIQNPDGVAGATYQKIQRRRRAAQRASMPSLRPPGVEHDTD